jgi:hypothetical protein
LLVHNGPYFSATRAARRGSSRVEVVASGFQAVVRAWRREEAERGRWVTNAPWLRPAR